jgi:hypothetical protein
MSFEQRDNTCNYEVQSMINPDRDEFVQDNPLAAATPPATGANHNEMSYQSSAEDWHDKLPSPRERTQTFVRENPVPIIVGALVVGLAAGWALRYSMREEKELDVKTPIGNLNWSSLSLPFLWPFFKSVKEKYEDSSDTIKGAVRDGVDRMRKVDVGDYTKPLRKRWKSWTH